MDPEVEVHVRLPDLISLTRVLPQLEFGMDSDVISILNMCESSLITLFKKRGIPWTSMQQYAELLTEQKKNLSRSSETPAPE